MYRIVTKVAKYWSEILGHEDDSFHIVANY